MAKQTKVSIGQRLTNAAAKKGLSTNQVAKKVGISAGFCAHLMADHIAIQPETAAKFTKVLGVKISKSELESHNEAARKSWKAYRAENKRKGKSARKTVSTSQQPTLPGFDLWNEVAQRIAEAVMKQQSNASQKRIKKA